jgi:glycosyltransferase involved in cell wall biosynthesis
MKRKMIQPRVSLCMIVKNEEANLAPCLEPVAALVDEIVIVDTGSSDGTREVAARFGARIFEFPWADSFAAARNESLRHAVGQWIFWLDGDDRLDNDNRPKLRALIADLKDDNIAYVMRCLCPAATAEKSDTLFDHVRLFRNLPGARWQYRVHEQILPALESLGAQIQRTDITIHHTGYQDETQKARKRERDLRLLLLEDAEHPGDPYTLFNLGWLYQESGALNDAWNYYRRSLEWVQPGQSFAPKLYAMFARVCRQLGRASEALAVCREGLARYPDHPEVLFQQAFCMYVLGDQIGTETSLLKLLTPTAPADTSFDFGADTGLRSYVTRNNLAVLYRDQGRFADAEAQWKAALAERPSFIDAMLGLGELYLGQNRWEEMENVLAELEAGPQTELQAAVLRGQKHLARREFDAARNILGGAIKRHPQALGPRLVLSRVLWQEGKDWAQVEQSLRGVLAIDPNNAEARSNLERLRPGQASQVYVT